MALGGVKVLPEGQDRTADRFASDPSVDTWDRCYNFSGVCMLRCDLREKHVVMGQNLRCLFWKNCLRVVLKYCKCV